MKKIRDSKDEDVHVIRARELTEVVEEEKEDFVPETQPLVVVKDDPNLGSQEVRDTILKLKTEIETDYAQLCYFLWYVKAKQFYTSWNYASLKEYVSKELGFQISKAYYLISVWSEIGAKQGKELFDSVVLEVGWSKAAQLKRVITAENADSWLEKARNLSVDSLIKEIRFELARKVPDDPGEALNTASEIEGTPIENEPKNITIKFHNVTDYQAFCAGVKFVTDAHPGMGNGEAVALICGDFLGSNSEGEDAKTFSLALMARLASMHGWECVSETSSQRRFYMDWKIFQRSGVISKKRENNMETERESSIVVKDIHVDSLVPNERNTNEMATAMFNRLVQEIKEVGFLSPLNVVPIADSKYFILGGEHRWKAAREAGMTYVPCCIHADERWKDMDEVDLETFKLNAISGEVNGEKFCKLYQRMCEKIGAERARDALAVTDGGKWKQLTKGIKIALKEQGATQDVLDEVEEASEKAKDPNDLHKKIDRILKKHMQGSSRAMIFQNALREHVLIQASTEVYDAIKKIVEVASNNQKDVNEMLAPVIIEFAKSLTLEVNINETSTTATN